MLLLHCWDQNQYEKDLNFKIWPKDEGLYNQAATPLSIEKADKGCESLLKGNKEITLNFISTKTRVWKSCHRESFMAHRFNRFH